MAIQKQLVITWVQDHKTKKTEWVVVHSRDVTYDDVREANRRLEDGQFVQSFMPTVFLDPQLDTADTRSWLQGASLVLFRHRGRPLQRE